MKLLVIEDEEGLREALLQSLRDEGYLADGAEDGETGFELLRSGLYDLVILDIMLPVIDGLEVLRRSRAQNLSVPVILLTARSAVDDKVRGMDLGADDYLTKPFALPELLARIRMVARRGSAAGGDGRIRGGDLSLNPGRYTLEQSQGRSIRLGAKEYQLMEYLLRNRGQILSREQITQRVWGYESEAEYNNVDVYVSFLRKKLRYLHSETVIRAVRGVGYVLGGQDD